MPIAISEYVPEPKENPFDEDIKELANAGEGKSGTILVKTSEWKKSKHKIAKAANALKLTAAFKVIEHLENNQTKFVITLGPMHKPRRTKSTLQISEN